MRNLKIKVKKRETDQMINNNIKKWLMEFIKMASTKPISSMMKKLGLL